MGFTIKIAKFNQITQTTPLKLLGKRLDRNFVFQAINRVLEERTTLLITHRLSQIRRADKVLVFHQGRLLDQGTHEELLARSELYQRIFARYQ